MASELVRNVWCDVHAQDADTRVPVSEEGTEVRLAVGKLSGVLDLCEDCINAHVVPLADFIESYARQTGKPTPGAPADGARRFPCPDCGKIYAYNNSLRTHIREVHKRVPTEATKPMGGPPRQCPYCTYRAANGPGLAQHIKSNHPDAWKGSLAAST